MILTATNLLDISKGIIILVSREMGIFFEVRDEKRLGSIALARSQERLEEPPKPLASNGYTNVDITNIFMDYHVMWKASALYDWLTVAPPYAGAKH